MITIQDLVNVRLYESEEAVIVDALRHLLRACPDLRINEGDTTLVINLNTLISSDPSGA